MTPLVTKKTVEEIAPLKVGDWVEFQGGLAVLAVDTRGVTLVCPADGRRLSCPVRCGLTLNREQAEELFDTADLSTVRILTKAEALDRLAKAWGVAGKGEGVLPRVFAAKTDRHGYWRLGGNGMQYMCSCMRGGPALSTTTLEELQADVDVTELHGPARDEALKLFEVANGQ